MKKIFLSLMVATLALAGCSKSDDNGGLSIEEGTVPTKVVNKSGNGILQHEATYNIQGGKILTFFLTEYDVDGVGVKKRSLTTITYDGDYPKTATQSTSIGTKENDYTETYEYYENGKLKSTSHKYAASQRTTVTTYSYNGDQLVRAVEEQPITRGNNGQVFQATAVTETDYNRTGDRITVTTTTYTKDTDGSESNKSQSVTIYTLANENLIKEERVSENSVREYTYDDKNNPDLNNLFKTIDPDYFINSGRSKNNVATSTQSYTNNNSVFRDVYEYTYNEKNYPTSKKEYRVTTTNGVESKVLTGQTEYTY